MSNKEVFKIFETKDYDQFKLSDNRKVTRHGIDVAKIKLFKTGKKCVIPISVTPTMVVREGQHRLKACQEMNIPVRFYKTNEIKKEYVSVIQGGSKWSLLNFVENHAKEGIPAFKWILNAYFNSGIHELIGMGSFGVLFQGKSFTSKQLSNKELKLTNEMKSCFNRNRTKLLDILCVNPDHSSILKSEKWVKALMVLFNMEKYKHEHLKNRLLTTTKQLTSSRQQLPVNIALLELYNYGLSENDKIVSI